MNTRWLMSGLLFFCLPLAAQQAGYTARAVDLKRQPFSDAEVVAQLPARTPLNVVYRQGAWMQVQAGQNTGWLRLLAVRMGAAGAARSSSESGLSRLFNVARSGSSGAVTTTGVRGLGKDEIANARPNPAELAKLDGYKVSEAEARGFANGQPPLAVRPVPYVSASGSPE